MRCKGCGNKKAYGVRTRLIDGELTETCDRCGSLQGVPDPSWTHHKERITEKATKNLKRGKHYYVPPKNEGSVGGVFEA